MRVAAAVLALPLVDARFLQKLRSKKLPTHGTNAYPTAIEACCACFKHKFQWPANAGTAATFAPEHTCDTCYVADRYAIPHHSKQVLTVEAPPPAALFLQEAKKKIQEMKHKMEGKKAKGSSMGPAGSPYAQEMTGDPCGQVCDEFRCVETLEDQTTKIEFSGPGGCDKMATDPQMLELYTGDAGAAPGTFSSMCDAMYPDWEHFGYLCPSSCGFNGCPKTGAPAPTDAPTAAPADDASGAGDDASGAGAASAGPKAGVAYKVIKSKQEQIQEWNWNCAVGEAPEDAASWIAGPVPGEPAGDMSARGVYLQCLEDPGFYCKGENFDFELLPGEKDAQKVEEPLSDTYRVSTQTLPDIKHP